jgi:hypothetical protein
MLDSMVQITQAGLRLNKNGGFYNVCLQGGIVREPNSNLVLLNYKENMWLYVIMCEWINVQLWCLITVDKKLLNPSQWSLRNRLFRHRSASNCSLLYPDKGLEGKVLSLVTFCARTVLWCMTNNKYVHKLWTAYIGWSYRRPADYFRHQVFDKI